MADTFQILPCSVEFAAAVEKHGGADLAWRTDADGVLQLRD